MARRWARAGLTRESDDLPLMGPFSPPTDTLYYLRSSWLLHLSTFQARCPRPLCRMIWTPGSLYLAPSSTTPRTKPVLHQHLHLWLRNRPATDPESRRWQEKRGQGLMWVSTCFVPYRARWNTRYKTSRPIDTCKGQILAYRSSDGTGNFYCCYYQL